MLLDGIHIPLTTPFSRDGRLYVPKLEYNVERFSKTPATGLIALGPGSEAGGLSDTEAREVLHTVAQTAAREKVLIAGVSRGSVRASLAVAEAAAGEGFDVVMARAPRLRQGDDGKETLVYFRALADASPLPVVLNSGYGASALPMAWVAELARHPNIIGMIDADLIPARYSAIADATSGVAHEVTVTQIFAAVTARMQSAEGPGTTLVSADALGNGGTAVVATSPQSALKTRMKQVGFQVLAAGSTDMFPALQAGAVGAAPLLAACAPQACYEVYAAWKDGDAGLAAEKSERVLAAAQLLNEELGVAGVKYACDLNGYYGGAPRLPRLPLDGQARARVDEAMREIRN